MAEINDYETWIALLIGVKEKIQFAKNCSDKYAQYRKQDENIERVLKMLQSSHRFE
jgi:hypothetical protein